MQRHFPVITGLLLTALAGCQSYTPYGYSYMNGGYNNYGNSYAPPPAGTTYIQPQPGSVYTPGMMRPAPPPGTSFSAPRMAPPAMSTQPAPRPGSYNSATIPPATPPGNRVPMPIEGPGAGSPAIAIPPGGGGQPPGNLGAPGNPDDDEDTFKKPVGLNPTGEQRTTNLLNDTEENVRKMGPEGFNDGKSSNTGKRDVNAKGASFESSDAAEMHRPNPYAFDPKTYKWLRGTLDYDVIDKKWHITYSGNPQEGDTYGGSLTLLDDKRLEPFITNDVVLVEGSIDVSKHDRFGRPMYRLSEIKRLRARPGSGPNEG